MITEHGKSEILFKFERDGTVEIMGMDLEAGIEEESRVFGAEDNEDMILQFIVDLENSDLTVFY